MNTQTIPPTLKVVFHHLRYANDGSHEGPSTTHTLRLLGKVPAPRGGVTHCNILSWETGTIISSGSARCSDRDAYNKDRGRLIALGRAIKKLETNHNTQMTP